MERNTNCATSQCHLYFIKIYNWTPAFSNQTFLCHIQIEHVQCVVDGFDLAHFDKPHLYGGKCTFEKISSSIRTDGCCATLHQNKRRLSIKTNGRADIDKKTTLLVPAVNKITLI